ncbi:hypothetical protein BC827DRAFT_1157052 [Russula dissimulans]|nr:hypothetical protein BC827DRAFT_1157052 [Russula dissimulans]
MNPTLVQPRNNKQLYGILNNRKKFEQTSHNQFTNAVRVAAAITTITPNSNNPNGNNPQHASSFRHRPPPTRHAHTPLSETKPKTEKTRDEANIPKISAIVSSSAVAIIWILVFLGWLWRQYKKRVRAQRRAARGLPPKVKKPKKPPQTFILPPDPAVITGQREPGERAIPRKQAQRSSTDKNKVPTSIELNERNRPVTEAQIQDERIARQVFAKHSPLDPPKHEKRGHGRSGSTG